MSSAISNSRRVRPASFFHVALPEVDVPVRKHGAADGEVKSVSRISSPYPRSESNKGYSSRGQMSSQDDRQTTSKVDVEHVKGRFNNTQKVDYMLRKR